MKIQYKEILKLDLFHQYYDDNTCHDFQIEPTLQTSYLLNNIGWIFRKRENGFNIYANVVPDSNPAELSTHVSDKSFKLVFILSLKNPNYYNYTDLPSFKPAKQVLYFSNLRDEQVDGLKLLGDQVVNQAIGNGISFITKNILNYEFAAPVNSATLTLTDVFNKNYPFKDQSFALPKPIDLISSHQIDLNKVELLAEGRYRINDSHGGSMDFYYAPTLFIKDVFALIEIYSDTLDFTNPSTNSVPTDYRFINNNQLTGNGNYAINFESKSIDWQYICRKKPENASNGISLNNLTITSTLGFPGAPSMIDGNAVFRSTSPVMLSETQQSVQLNHNGTKILDLPNPGPAHQLQEDSTGKYFGINIYV